MTDFSSRNEYDRSVNTFNQEGRLYQVEYAIEAVKLGSSALGIKVKEGVIVAVERRIESNSTLMEPKSFEKLSEIDNHIICAASGLVTDARTLVDFARTEASNHKFVYNEPIMVKALTQSVSDQALNFGEGDSSQKKKPMSRPYGVALLIAGVDENGPALFQTDPSGTMIEFKAKGIGAADDGIQSILQEKYKEDLSLNDAQKLALDCLKQVMEEKIRQDNVEMWIIPTQTRQCVQIPETQINEIIKTLV